MIQEIGRIQEIDIFQIDILLSDDLQHHLHHPKFLVHDVALVIENSSIIKLHPVPDTLIFITNEGTLDLLPLFLPEFIAIVFSLDRTLDIDSNSEITILHIGFRQDHVLDLRLHLEDLAKKFN